ncbi:MAG: UDP-galactopyranose mutase [Frankiales bacterium]|nr:UDP-galactopyranose mutase [Frankiales bacterium]
MPARRTHTRNDWLVVGSGLTGATFARCLAEEAGASVLVVDQRDHIGGNVFDSLDERGIRVQRYGAHIFHTGSADIFEYLSRFTDWYHYEHRVLADVDGQLVPVPFNFTSLDTLLPERSGALQQALLEAFPGTARIPVAQLARAATPQLRELGEYIAAAIFRNYTAKQWGRPIEQVDPTVLERVPVTLSYDDRYFRDEFQAIPAGGYTAMVEAILDHPLISVALQTDGATEHQRRPDARLLWTGRVDSFFDYRYGELPYRSLRFENTPGTRWRELPAAVVNHPGVEPFTRIIDHSYFAAEPTATTTLTYEYPAAYERGQNEPFYPVSDAISTAMYQKYAALADRTGVLFGGRLGDFRYYDMHQAVGRARTLADTVLHGRADPRTIARSIRRSA